MLLDVVEAKALEPYRLWLKFENGEEGTVDVAGLVPFEGVFERLRDPKVFSAVSIELGTVCWPTGADLDPEVLYETACGKSETLKKKAN